MVQLALLCSAFEGECVATLHMMFVIDVAGCSTLFNVVDCSDGDFIARSLQVVDWICKVEECTVVASRDSCVCASGG